jgi:hypothetical protein
MTFRICRSSMVWYVFVVPLDGRISRSMCSWMTSATVGVRFSLVRMACCAHQVVPKGDRLTGRYAGGPLRDNLTAFRSRGWHRLERLTGGLGGLLGKVLQK